MVMGHLYGDFKKEFPLSVSICLSVSVTLFLSLYHSLSLSISVSEFCAISMQYSNLFYVP